MRITGAFHWGPMGFQGKSQGHEIDHRVALGDQEAPVFQGLSGGLPVVRGASRTLIR